MQTAIVVFPANGVALCVGTVLRGSGVVARAEARGEEVLPIEDRLWRDRSGPAASHFIDYFGSDGIPLTGNDPRRVASMLLDIDPECPWIHWMIGVRANGPSPTGSFGLVAAPAAGLVACSLSEHQPLRISPEFTTDRSMMEVIGGRARVQGLFKGLAAFQIHAVASDVQLDFAAISQCAAPEQPRWLGG